MLQNFFSSSCSKNLFLIPFKNILGRNADCLLGLFQLIPHSQKEPATKFSDIGNSDFVMKSCSLKEGKPVLAKFPDNATEMEWRCYM